MKKHRIFGVAFIWLVCLFSIPSVYAKDCDLDANGLTTTGTCCTQAAADNRYKPKVVRNASNHTITVSVKSGRFKISVTGTISNSNIDKDIIDKDTQATITYSSRDDLESVIELTLLDTDDLCLVGNNKGLTQGSDSDQGVVKYTFTLSSTDGNYSKVTNSSYNTVCKAFREGTGYDNYFNVEGFTSNSYNKLNYNSVNNEGKSYYKNQVLSYCFSKEVETDYSQSLVTTMIINAMNSWDLKNFSSSTTELLTPTGGSYVDPDKTDMSDSPLKCDPWTLPASDDDSQYYVNQNKYYTRKSDSVYADVNGDGDSEEVCKTTCQEEITVQYGAPVASKAGLCFEYKVKVISKVTCNATVNRNLEPTMPSVCEPYPVCNGYVGYTDQGGPSEDFDACINTCDNGNYSQKCINKCYKKVYGTTSVGLSLDYNNKYTVTNMADNNSCGSVKNNSAASWEDVYSAIQNNSSGKYKWNSDGSISWDTNNSQCYWDKFGRYYFHSTSRAERTVLNLQGKNYTSPSSGVVYAGRLGSNGQYGYELKAGGFIAATNCSETCSWNVNGDQNSCKYLNPEDAIEEYNERLAAYNDAISKCVGKASCSTSTAEFTIQVNNKTTKNPNEDNWIKYDKATLTGITKVDKDNIILDKGGCYGETSTEYDYMTEWSFPGTWINNKTGEIRYEPTTSTEWHKKEGKFCTLLDSADVNTKWWNWKEINSNTGCTLSGEGKQSILDEVNSNQNIKATVRNFGYFKWGFDISCFYSLNSNTGSYTETEASENCPIDDECDPDVEVCEKISVNNYKFRNVTTSNLFPGDDDTTSLTGRETGFNWNYLATNINNENYQITPTALIKAIQERQSEIYSEANESKYLDYEFTLDRATIKKIRNYNKTQGNNYTNYSGSTSIKNGITVYESNLFRYGGEIYNSSNVLGTLGCNNQEGETCETFTDDYVNSLKGSR